MKAQVGEKAVKPVACKGRSGRLFQLRGDFKGGLQDLPQLHLLPPCDISSKDVLGFRQYQKAWSAVQDLEFPQLLAIRFIMKAALGAVEAVNHEIKRHASNCKHAY